MISVFTKDWRSYHGRYISSQRRRHQSPLEKVRMFFNSGWFRCGWKDAFLFTKIGPEIITSDCWNIAKAEILMSTLSSVAVVFNWRCLELVFLLLLISFQWVFLLLCAVIFGRSCQSSLHSKLKSSSSCTSTLRRREKRQKPRRYCLSPNFLEFVLRVGWGSACCFDCFICFWISVRVMESPFPDGFVMESHGEFSL